MPKNTDLYPASMARIVPEKQHGIARLSYVTVTPEVARHENIMGAIGGSPSFMYVEPGTYARLHVDGTLMMSDTQMERRTNREFLRQAHGRVLVAGLGIGLILHAVLKKREVTSVTVLEKYADVVKLVAPTLSKFSRKLDIITTDVHDYAPPTGVKFNTVYFDIWPTISTDNLPEMGRLQKRAHASWIDKSDPDRWVGSWLRDYLLAQQASERRSGW